MTGEQLGFLSSSIVTAKPARVLDLPGPVGDVLRGSSAWHIHHGDAFEFLRSLPAESIDLVSTDVPYESLELHRAKGTTTRLKVSEASSNEWFGIIKNETLPELMREIFRVLKPDRHAYLWCDEATADVIKSQQFYQAWQSGDGPRRNNDGSFPCVSGLHFWRSLCWVKTNKAGKAPAGGMGFHWRGAKEWILFFEKGRRKLNELGLPDVLMFPRPSDVDHATPKPVGASELLVRNSTQPGEVVLDPFSGSASTLRAALLHGRRAIGCDLDPKSVENSRRLCAGINAPTAPPPEPAHG